LPTLAHHPLINEKWVQVAGKVAKSLARFIEPMECLPVQKLPVGGNWLYEIKLDGWRLESVKTSGKVMLYSRRGKSFNSQFRDIANALNYLPDETVIDGEVVAIDENGRPSFNLLQNFRSAGTNIQYFAFDILMHKGKELTRLPLSQRRQVLASVIKPDTYVEISEACDRPLSEDRNLLPFLPIAAPDNRVLHHRLDIVGITDDGQSHSRGSDPQLLAYKDRLSSSRTPKVAEHPRVRA
jgi:ATP-dependent DNA ligase